MPRKLLIVEEVTDDDLMQPYKLQQRWWMEQALNAVLDQNSPKARELLKRLDHMHLQDLSQALRVLESIIQLI